MAELFQEEVGYTTSFGLITIICVLLKIHRLRMDKVVRMEVRRLEEETILIRCPISTIPEMMQNRKD